MANTTAADVGLRGKAAAALGRLIAASRDGTLAEHVVERRILRIENIRGATAQRGLMFGAGAITDAIEFCCRQIYARGLNGKLGMSVALAGLLLGAVLRRSANRVLRSHAIGVALDGAREDRADRLLVLATTLDRLMLWSRPFWNYDGQPIRYTGIAYPPEHLVRSAPKVLYGWRRQTLPPEVYHSQGAWRIAVRVDAPFTVDGEMFHPLAEQPVVITASDPPSSSGCEFGEPTASSARTDRRRERRARGAIDRRRGASRAAAPRPRRGGGAVLRQLSANGDDVGSMVDLYLLADSYEKVHRGPLMRLLNRLLPPNVYYIETPFAGRTVRAKYALLTLEQFERLVDQQTLESISGRASRSRPSYNGRASRQSGTGSRGRWRPRS